MDSQYRNLLDSVIKITRQTGELIRSLRGTALISEKASNNLVTEADTKAEKLLSNELTKLVPGSKVLGEEYSSGTGIYHEKLWVIDPIDGTNNYAQGIPHYCVSIAYAENGETTFGVVYDAERDELFSAVKFEGAFLNGKKIQVSQHKTIQEFIVATGFHYDRGELMERTLVALHTLFKQNIRGMRRSGSAALDLCWVACGRFDAYYEYKLSTWDFAAGMLIIQEAGGLCSDRSGNPLSLSSESVVVSNGLSHEKFVQLVKWECQRTNIWE